MFNASISKLSARIPLAEPLIRPDNCTRRPGVITRIGRRASIALISRSLEINSTSPSRLQSAALPDRKPVNPICSSIPKPSVTPIWVCVAVGPMDRRNIAAWPPEWIFCATITIGPLACFAISAAETSVTRVTSCGRSGSRPIMRKSLSNRLTRGNVSPCNSASRPAGRPANCSCTSAPIRLTSSTTKRRCTSSIISRLITICGMVAANCAARRLSLKLTCSIIICGRGTKRNRTAPSIFTLPEKRADKSASNASIGGNMRAALGVMTAAISAESSRKITDR